MSISTCIHIFATSNCWGYHVQTFPEAWYWCSTALSSVVSWNQLRRWVSCPRRFYVNVSTCVYTYIHIHTTHIYIHTYFLCVSMNIRVYVYTVYVHPYMQRLEHPFVRLTLFSFLSQVAAPHQRGSWTIVASGLHASGRLEGG